MTSSLVLISLLSSLISSVQRSLILALFAPDPAACLHHGCRTPVIAPPRDPQHIVEAERAAYHDELPAPAPDWPPDVRAVYDILLDRLFDIGLTAQAVVEDCGIGSHSIYSRFHLFVGTPIKSFVIHHRMACAKRLLRHGTIPIFRIAHALFGCALLLAASVAWGPESSTQYA
jgi:AraC-like DNA-binding protein